MGIKVTRGQVSKKLARVTGLQAGSDIAPTELGDRIIPTLNVDEDPEKYIVANVGRATTGASTVFTTPTDRDFYLSNLYVSYTCDVAADSTNYAITITPRDTAAVNIVEMRKQTLTVTTDVVNLSFTTPILLERGTAITLTQTFTLGASAMSASIVGFTRDPSDL